MNCDEFVELVTAFLDGSLDQDTEAAFLDHLSECDGCERYLDQFRVTIGELGRLPPETLTQQAHDTLLDAFRDWHAR
ncbi:zf-HC2 domain-containing protein [Actinocrispum sp. NPDC049592]|uniref:anti-sigma factor family protein n=1 Tax=Actinocrispum sp. NPDC049592 TaxID=3154835 RepID=UPI003433ABD8